MEQTLGKRITACRKRLGMTQDKLAERLGVTAQAVSKWENDQSCPDITMLPKLAEIFGITTDELLGLEARKKEIVHEAQIIEGEPQDGTFHVNTGENQWDFKWDAGRKSSVGMAVWVLLVGGLLLAANLLHWNTGLWEIAWPSGLLVFGLFGLFPNFSFFRLGCALFGGYSLLNNLNTAMFSIGKELLLPIFILLFGLSLLADAVKKNAKPRFTIFHNGKNVYSGQKPDKVQGGCTMTGKSFCSSISFGEERHLITVPRLSSGDASVSFGELTVDLTGCGEIAEDARISASCSFGELNILVPKTCRAEISSSTAFGSVDVEGAPTPDASTVMCMECSANFGEITVHYL